MSALGNLSKGARVLVAGFIGLLVFAIVAPVLMGATSGIVGLPLDPSVVILAAFVLALLVMGWLV